MRGETRVATQGQARVDGTSTTSSSPTCPRTLKTKRRIHQRKTRRNTPVTEHTASEPAQHGEGLKQTEIYMRSDKAEPGDSPRQPKVIDKGSARAEPVPVRMTTKPRWSSRIKAGPQAPLTARDKRAKTRTINRQVIGSKQNSAKYASRKNSVVTQDATRDQRGAAATNEDEQHNDPQAPRCCRTTNIHLLHPVPKKQANSRTRNPRGDGATANDGGDHKERIM